MDDWKSNAFFWCSCGPGEKSTSHFPAGRAGLSPHTLDGDSGAKLINKDSNLRPSSELTSSEITCISNSGVPCEKGGPLRKAITVQLASIERSRHDVA